MSMCNRDLDTAIAEAQRFIQKARAARCAVKAQHADYVKRGIVKFPMPEGWTADGSPETAACKRASMDLTRALAALRNYKR